MKISIQDPLDPKHESHVYTDKDFVIEDNKIYLKTPFSHCIMTLEIDSYRKVLIDHFTRNEIGRIIEKDIFTHRKMRDF